MNQLKRQNEASVQIFLSLVPTAIRQSGRGNPPVFLVGGHLIRVKRAKDGGNQVHPLYLQTIAVHVPGAGPGTWYLVPPSWQWRHALSGAATAQHALHPLECMKIFPRDFTTLSVPAATLASRVSALSPPSDAMRDLAKRAKQTLSLQREQAEQALSTQLAPFMAVVKAEGKDE